MEKTSKGTIQGPLHFTGTPRLRGDSAMPHAGCHTPRRVRSSSRAFSSLLGSGTASLPQARAGERQLRKALHSASRDLRGHRATLHTCGHCSHLPSPPSAVVPRQVRVTAAFPDVQQPGLLEKQLVSVKMGESRRLHLMGGEPV